LRKQPDGSGVVDAGQFLERMTTLAVANDTVLEALFHRGAKRPGVVIAPGVPGAGGSMEGAVVTELAWAIATHGHPTLRFNFRGVGASTGPLDLPMILDGERTGLENALERMSLDLVAAIERQRENIDHGPVAVVGYDIGAIVALLASRHARAEALLLVAPPLALFERVRAHVGVDHPPTTLFLPGAAAGSPPHVEALPAGANVITIPDADAAFTQNLALLGRRVVDTLDDRRPVWIER
jgi:alpha/beta superfamily hydrolase